jgi:geranylgeranyl diphosphate synthase, type III
MERPAENEYDESGIYEQIIRPYTYLSEQTSGKGFRTRLLNVFNMYYGVSSAELLAVGEFIGILHNASLLVDDVEDEGATRRGKVCAHRVYGLASTINAGNLMYFKAMEGLLTCIGGGEGGCGSGLKDGLLSGIIVRAMVKLHIGQGKEIHWRESGLCPSEEEYEGMVIGKTGELFKLGVEILACLSDKKDAVTDVLLQYCETLGVVYQITNDVDDLDLKVPSASASAGVNSEEERGHDLIEGKYSFPLIYCVRHRGMSVSWQQDKEMLAVDYAARAAICQQIADLGGLEYAHQRVRTLISAAQKRMQQEQHEQRLPSEMATALCVLLDAVR